MAARGEDAPVDLSIDEVIARARTLLRRSVRTMLGIVGPPGAGKSTVTKALQGALGDAMVVVPMDGFHLSNEVLITLGRRHRKGAPDTFDVGGFAALLRRIHGAEPDQVIYAPRFDRQLEESIGSAIPVPGSARLIVVEGNYLLHRDHGWGEIGPLLDETWYLDVTTEEIRRRLVARRVGHGHEHDAAEAWVRDVDEPNARTVLRSRPHADLVLRLDARFAPPMLDSKETP